MSFVIFVCAQNKSAAHLAPKIHDLIKLFKPTCSVHLIICDDNVGHVDKLGHVLHKGMSSYILTVLVLATITRILVLPWCIQTCCCG